jgi:hypothetical protein
MSGEKQFSRKEFLRFLGVGAAGLAIGSPVSWIRESLNSLKKWMPRLCAALKKENPGYSNYDIREIIMKD